jgi:hypothetical protein
MIKQATILIRFVKIVYLIIVICVYLITKLSNYINYQLEKALEIIYESIIQLVDNKKIPNAKQVKEHLIVEVLRLTTLIGKVTCTAFWYLRDIYIYLMNIQGYKNVSKSAESQLNYLYKLLQFSLPYLELTSKLFYLNVYIRELIPLYL